MNCIFCGKEISQKEGFIMIEENTYCCLPCRKSLETETTKLAEQFLTGKITVMELTERILQLAQINKK